MDERFAKTRYRVAQKWRFRNDTPEASDILTVLAVEDHPTQGILCQVHLEYDPPFAIEPRHHVNLHPLWLTQAALDRSVIELVAERAPLPRRYGSTGDFRCGPDDWEVGSHSETGARTIGEFLREETERYRQERVERAARPPYQRPPAETVGLWSLIAYGYAERFRELLRRHPDLACKPLPRDPTDEYCYSGEEYEECYPLMLAVELEKTEIVRILLEAGADPRQVNARGETALHFAGRSKCEEDAAEIARTLCELGADPEARNMNGKTPMTCGCCRPEVAKVLIRFGATPTLNHALLLGMFDWARRELKENPAAVREAVFPEQVLTNILFAFQREAERRIGREIRLGRGDISIDDEDDFEVRMAHSQVIGCRRRDDGRYDMETTWEAWRRMAEFERAVFEENRDLLESALEKGADPNVGNALFSAVQMYDTSFTEWLLTHGANPNRDVERGSATFYPEVCRTRRMKNLLLRFGAKDNPYEKEVPSPEMPWDRLSERLKEGFD